MLERMGATVDKAKDSLVAMHSMEEDPDTLLRNFLQSILMLKEKLAIPETAVKKYILGIPPPAFCRGELNATG